MKIVAFDTETTGLDCYTGDEHIFAYATCDTDGNTEVYRDNTRNFKEKLQALFSDITIHKVCHNLKFDLAMVQKYGIKVPEETVFHDTMIISQLLNNLRKSHALDSIAYELGGWDSKTDNEIALLTKGGVTYDKVPVEIMDRYQREDVERTMLIFLTLFPDVKKDKRLYEDYRNEIDLIQATISMERNGLRIDKESSINMINWLEDEIHDCYNNLYTLTGERLNCNSPQQLNYLLYTKLKIEPIKKKKKESKFHSTDKEVLFQLREKYLDNGNKHIINVLNEITRFRSYSGALPRIKNYLKHTDTSEIIHASINTNSAKTGRESIKDPPLQGVSKNASLFNTYPVPMRKLFKAKAGTVLYMPDYSGIEMRLIVDVAQEPEMLQIFKDGRNSHEIAAKLFYQDKFISKKESKTLYDSGKNAHFALPYGASKYKLSRILGLTVGEGVEAYKRYAKRFPLIANLMRSQAEFAKENGYIETAFGRKLNVPRDSLHSALNYRIQGTGAGILKRAQVRLHKLFLKKYNGEVKLILPIHDELIIEYPRNRLKYQPEFVKDVTKEMITFSEFKIPLETEWKMTTTTWNNVEDIT